ncbi:EAL domain-containing protein [Bacillus sp. 31A1R]|uniref:EAL domain-containing protein n=1 Tax=Robertmurraya mangrovi TaxID=3098077 RepID=A0ABU5IYM2_9BACI|nr:EAL domain-containing protein [Bacillus sp. 31A1R]MDZ5472192.1 EAL domain-containing protein [Bacillus sp. 31A1R]
MEKVSTPRLKETIEEITNIKHSPYVLYFQPQICLNSQEIIGLEVLLRKRNHYNQIINPNEFIPELERTKEIITVGKWIIQNSVLQLAKWQQSGYKGMLSINISVVQLTDESLIPFIKEVLELYQVQPSQIEFELTESFPVENGQLLIMLDWLKQIGFRLALDDFGTGFSSLSYLESYLLIH